MKRALFVSEWTHALFVQVIVVSALLLVVGAAASAGQFDAGLMFGGMFFVFSGFFVELVGLMTNRLSVRQLPLLLTLPLSRAWIWLIVAGAHALAALIPIVTLVSLLHLRYPDNWYPAASAVWVYSIFTCLGIAGGMSSDAAAKLSFRAAFMADRSVH